MAQSANNKKERGKFLIVMLLLSILSIILSLPSYLANQATLSAHGITFTPPPWALGYSVIANVAQVAALYGIWQWKKWGVFLLFVVMGLAILLAPSLVSQAMPSLSNTLRQDTTLYVYLVPIVNAALWLWSINRKWSYFE